MYGGAKLQLLGLFGHALTSEATPRETEEEREKPSSGFGVAFTRLGTCAMYMAAGANKLFDEDWRQGTAGEEDARVRFSGPAPRHLQLRREALARRGGSRRHLVVDGSRVDCPDTHRRGHIRRDF